MQINDPYSTALSLLHDHIDGFLANTFANVYWKDQSGKYLGINDVFVKQSGVNSYADVVGVTDKDQVWHQQADLMMENDKVVVQAKCVKTAIEQALHPDGHIVHYLSHKTPLRNRLGKVIGVFGLSYGFETEAWNIDRLNEVAMIVGTPGVEHIKRYLLDQQQKKYKLSKQQINCLHFLIKGMTTKQIAQVLSLSHRTVGHYLDTVKEKLGCSSKAELIAKVFELNIY